MESQGGEAALQKSLTEELGEEQVGLQMVIDKQYPLLPILVLFRLSPKYWP